MIRITLVPSLLECTRAAGSDGTLFILSVSVYVCMYVTLRVRDLIFEQPHNMRLVSNKLLRD